MKDKMKRVLLGVLVTSDNPLNIEQLAILISPQFTEEDYKDKEPFHRAIYRALRSMHMIGLIEKMYGEKGLTWWKFSFGEVRKRYASRQG